MAVVQTPDYTGTIDQQFFLTPLGGPQHPINYLDRFPEEIYRKSLDSHLVRFMYALLGPAGIGWLRKNALEARLLLEDFGIETFDLDGFYGDPLGFARILEEQYDIDPGGLVPRDRWEEIRAKDARYRNRAIDYVNGARAGNTPFGMHLVARSGLGHEVEIIENYRYIYDQLSDDVLGIPKMGYTNSTEEMVVIPRRELPMSEVQIISINGLVTGGTFDLFFPMGNETTHTVTGIPYNATRLVVQALLETIPSIGRGGVEVRGGPLPANPLEVHFTGRLAFKNVPQLQVVSNILTGTTIITVSIVTDRDGTNQLDEIVNIADVDKHHLKEALSRIKPVSCIVTFGSSKGATSVQPFSAAYAGSVYNEVVRFVTGQQGVNWPTRDSTHWIEKGVEHDAPRTLNDLKHHYQGFHNVTSVSAYDENSKGNEHIGPFNNYQRSLFPILSKTPQTPGTRNALTLYQYTADKALADYAEPLTINAIQGDTTGTPTSLVNGIYPIDYQSLPGVPEVRYREEQFYASVERTDGVDYLEIDLGNVQAVNYLYMEITRKPYNIELAYDVLDLDTRQWEPVKFEPESAAPTHIGYEAKNQNPWLVVEYNFCNSLDRMIYTRYLRLKMTRRSDPNSPFVSANGAKLPYSIEVRNMRVGRNVS